MRQSRILLTAILTVLSLSCSKSTEQTMDAGHGQYWKNQVLTDVLPFWTQHARDTLNGGFFTTLDSAWKPYGDTRKYPSMLSRHVFGYSVGYLLSGNQQYLDIARQTVDYLLTHAWDTKYDGWFNALDEQGNPQDSAKSMFVQVYATTGLAMYYFVTRDPKVLDIIEKANTRMESYAWDHRNGGYFNVMTRDWQVKDSTKSISSEITPVSGYLLYLYQATHDSKYLKQAQRILDQVTGKMIDPASGWVLETFSPDWKYLSGLNTETEVSTGHNIEVAWMLYRYFLITGQKDDLERANRLASKIYRYGNQPDINFWYNSIGRLNPESHEEITYWWIQAYGIMFDLCAYRMQQESKYLTDYQKGAKVWNTWFLDKKNGDTHFSVMSNGTIKQTHKADQFKASYHNAENGLLNYLYLNAWVTKEPVELYFKITEDLGDKPFYACPLEGNDLSITKIESDQRPGATIAPDGQSATISGLHNTRIKVTLQANTK